MLREPFTRTPLPCALTPAALAATLLLGPAGAAGANLYAEQCAGCHDESGTGSDRAPPLVQQYPAYLRKQIADFATGRRSHPEAAACGAPSPAETEALLHHLVELGK